MTGWLLDTNVISEIRRPRPNESVLAFIASQPAETLYLSSITLAEIRYGIQLLETPERRLAYQDWLEGTVRPMFASRIPGVTEDTLLRWRLLVREGRLRGRTYPEPDLLMASVAQQNGMTLVTRNIADFEGLDVIVFNPWAEN